MKCFSLQQMGACIGPSSRRKPPQNTTIYQLCQAEVEILHLIFQDLSERTVDRMINLQNFILFFHKNGYWGQRLFKQFKPLDKKYISEDEFVNGVARIFKSTKKEKIRLLFKFFSKSDGGENSGVFFNEFLILLYNYPKQDLKEILNDKSFIEYELQKRMKRPRPKKSENLVTNKELNLSRRQFSCDERREQSSINTIREESKAEDQSIASIVGEQIFNNTHEYQPHRTIIGLRHGDKVYDIKTINIQQVVKQFALKVFKDAKIDHVTGKLNFEQFYNWIIEHKALFENYYEGFHYQVWQFDAIAKKPRFLTSIPEKISPAKIIIEYKCVSIQLYLFHSILVACEEDDEHPIAVICLEGLAVTKLCDSTHGFGLAINHRDKIYTQKKIFLKDEPLLQEWLGLLRFYKGETIHEKYIICQKIGTGKFSVVYKCKHVIQQREYALKEIATFRLDPEALELIAHESAIMQIIQHPLILGFKEYFQTKKHIYIITEYVSGVNLFEEVKKYEVLEEYDAAKVAQMIIVGVSYMHSMEIIHRDLKPENIMVVHSQSSDIDFIKIIDLGFSNYLSQLNDKSSNQTISGTPNYIAPEVLREEKLNYTIDNFAIGVIIYFMLTGALPFNGYSIPEILQNTLIGDYSYPYTRDISDNAKDIIDKFLKNDPKERLSLHDSLKHPWFDILKSRRKKPRENPRRNSVIFS